MLKTTPNTINIKKCIVNGVVQQIIVGEALNGNKLAYQEAYEEECAKHQTLVVCFGNSILQDCILLFFVIYQV